MGDPNSDVVTVRSTDGPPLTAGQKLHLDGPPSNKVVDIALAEFSALRNEIDNLANAQRTVMNMNITVVAAIAGFVLANRADPHLLIALPIASGAIGLLYQWYIVHAKHIGDYIDEVLRPILVEHAGDSRVFSWEYHLRSTVYRRRGSGLSSRLAYILLFPTVTTVSLVVVIPYLDSLVFWLAWAFATLLGLTQIIVWWSQVRHWVCWT